MLYEAVNLKLLPQLPKKINRILDVGCGSGTLGRRIKQDVKCDIIGVTYSEFEAKIASQYLDRVIVCNLNQFKNENFKGKEFDCIICSHILEHLYEPQNLLKQLHDILSPNGILIVALPNILHWKQRLEFIKGKFRYSNGGLMDRTHFRFFDWETAHKLLEENGYLIIKAEADGNFPLPRIRQFLPISLQTAIDRKAVQKFPGLFGVQFIFSCCSRRTQ